MPIDYSYYPFLTRAIKNHIKSFDNQEILYAKNHIEKYTTTKMLDTDLSVWLISMIMLRNLENSYLSRKFVSNYGKLFELKFSKDIKTKDIRLEILDYFDIINDIEFFKVSKLDHIRIHVTDYLQVEDKGFSVSAPQFKLINQTLSKGFVTIEYPHFIYLLRIGLEYRLLAKIKSMKYYSDNPLINKYVDEFKLKYIRFDKLKPPSTENIPQSIQELIDIAYRDHHLNHRQRIRLGIYLQKNNFDWDYILEIYKQLSDYSEKTTTYQLKSLRRYL